MNADGFKDQVIDIESDNESINNSDDVPLIVSRQTSDPDDLFGRVVNSEEEAYNLYNDYAINLGFSVRRRNRRLINDVVRHVNFCCSKEGFRKDGDPSEGKKTHRLETRTGCTARIRFSLQDNSLWKVALFDREHNHDFASPEERIYLRSGRDLSDAHGGVIKSMYTAGIRTTNTFAYMAEEAGRSQNVGFTKTDCYNFLSRERMNMLEAGDAQSLINLFKKKQIEDPMFFYTVQVDQENRMTNFFWRDGRSKIDFECFGDVVVFDTTYRTNKYNMICAPFVGVNQHWKNVLFGCAFLLDETTSSFVWLFQTFLEAMDGQKPKTIFTDRCQAMANAIEEVFPETRHRLCLWHISKNAASNLSSLYRDPEFSELFNKWLFGRVTEVEFQSTWNELIVKFNLGGNTWLKTLYDLREKWCALYSKDTFSAGILSTQRSESTNNVFTRMSTKIMTLTEFVHHYDKQAEQMRSSEAEETFRCNNGVPSKAARSSGIKKQAGMTYTRKIYNLFENEFVNSLEVNMKEVGTDGSLQTFELNEEGHKRVYIVQFDRSNTSISCSCQMFESLGWLCRHALRVLNIKNINQIPAQYILKRWTKAAKKRGEADDDEQLQMKEKSTVSLRRNILMRRAYNIFSKGAETYEGSKIAMQKLTEATDLIEKSMKKLSVKDVNQDQEASEIRKLSTLNSDDETPVLNPSGVWPKGMTNKRMKDAMEKKQKKRTARSQGSSKKTKAPTSDGPSQEARNIYHNSSVAYSPGPSHEAHIYHNSSVGYSPSPPMRAYINNQFPTTSLSTINTHAQYPISNMNPISSWTFAQPNFYNTSMIPIGAYFPQYNQNSSTTFGTTHLGRPIPQLNNQDLSFREFDHQPDKA